MLTNVNRTWAVDTSVAVAALDESHAAHEVCRRTAAARRPALAGHAAFETYSVLTRLPGAGRATPETVSKILQLAFPERCWLTADQSNSILERLAVLDIAGGMVYDALVAEAARVNGHILLTRDTRAQRTYERLAVTFEIVD